MILIFMKTFALLCSACLLLISCGFNGKSYYTLNADGPAPAGGGMAIGVGPVMVAEYIDRPNLVVAETNHQLGIAENHRWAGDLGAGIARVTAVNLGRRWGTGNVRTYPWRDEDGLRRQVVIDIRQFHAGADGYAVLEAGWRVYSLPERRLLASRSFSAREPLETDGYPAMVAAQSRLLSCLADDIAQVR
jgi:uncharacterized lipoprotein YmbA